MDCRAIILGLALAVVCDAYSGGAPAGVCDSMLPQHGLDAQTSDFPYSFTTTKKGTQILITLKTKTTTDSFKGFILQVRDANGKPIGSFNTPPDTKSIDCSSGKKNALTHTSSKEKKEIKAMWTAPTNFVGSAFPIITVARTGAVFWVGHSSPKVDF